MEKVLITGATGFLGYHIVERMVKEGYEVFAMGRKNEEKVIKLGAKFIKADINENIDFLGYDFDYIVHSCALSDVWGEYEDFYKVNVLGTKNMIKFAEKNKNLKRFVHISTPSIYSSFEDKENIKENINLPKKFLNNYSKTKYMAELELKKTKIPYIILRPRALFGEYDTSIIPRLIEANKTQGIPLFNKGDVLVDLTYAPNVAQAIYLAMNCDKKFIGEIYNVTNGETIILKNALVKIFKKLNIKPKYKNISYKLAILLAYLSEFLHKTILKNKIPKLTVYIVCVLGKTQTLDISKIKKDLGYEPIYTIDEGIINYAKWYRENEN